MSGPAADPVPGYLSPSTFPSSLHLLGPPPSVPPPRPADGYPPPSPFPPGQAPGPRPSRREPARDETRREAGRTPRRSRHRHRRPAEHLPATGPPLAASRARCRAERAGLGLGSCLLLLPCRSHRKGRTESGAPAGVEGRGGGQHEHSGVWD